MDFLDMGGLRKKEEDSRERVERRSPGAKSSERWGAGILRPYGGERLVRGGLGDGDLLGGVLDGEHVGAHFVPLAEHQAVGGEETADFGGVPAEDFFDDGDEDAHGVVAEDGAAGDAGDELGFGDGDGEAVVLVDVHHDGEIGAAVAHVDDVVVADAEGRADFLEDGDFAPAGGGADDGLDLASGVVVLETRAEDVLRGNDAFEGRLDNLLRGGGDNVEMKVVALGKSVENACEKGDVVLEADALAGGNEVVAADAAEFGIVENEIAEFRALLDEVHLG